jgi:membrane protease YdiL (CAAX protease family)
LGDRSVFLITAGAILLFLPLFIIQEIGPFDFWWWFALVIFILCVLTFLSDRPYFARLVDDLQKNTLLKILCGLISSILLYGFFYGGNIISLRMFRLAGTGIAQIYQYREGGSTLKIVLFMICIIGPGEELFWRGFIQDKYSKKIGKLPGFLITALLYGSVHIGSLNPMLVTAAFFCGLFWGSLTVYVETLTIAQHYQSHSMGSWGIYHFSIQRVMVYAPEGLL